MNEDDVFPKSLSFVRLGAEKPKEDLEDTRRPTRGRPPVPDRQHEGSHRGKDYGLPPKPYRTATPQGSQPDTNAFTPSYVSQDDRHDVKTGDSYNTAMSQSGRRSVRDNASAGGLSQYSQMMVDQANARYQSEMEACRRAQEENAILQAMLARSDEEAGTRVETLNKVSELAGETYKDSQNLKAKNDKLTTELTAERLAKHDAENKVREEQDKLKAAEKEAEDTQRQLQLERQSCSSVRSKESVEKDRKIADLEARTA